MSYDISIKDEDGQVLEAEAPHHIRGGTYAVGGTTVLHLNITYNYVEHFCAVLGDEGIRSIYGKKVADTIPTLTAAIQALEGMPEPELEPHCVNAGEALFGKEEPRYEPWDPSDYWAPTVANAKRALQDLVSLGLQGLSGYWDGD